MSQCKVCGVIIDDGSPEEFVCSYECDVILRRNGVAS